MENNVFAKNEITHEVLDARNDNDSARYKAKIGQELPGATVLDKICYPPNVCPRCKSEATFHRRMQQHGDIMNIWRTEQKGDSDVTISVKYDFCLDCHREFIFEIFILRNP